MRVLPRVAAVFVLFVLFARFAAGQDDPAVEKPAVWQLVLRIADAKGFRADVDALHKHLAAVASGAGRTVQALRRVQEALASPWAVPAIARELRDGLSAPFAAKGRGDLEPLVKHAADFLDLDLVKAEQDDPRFDALDALWQEIAGATPEPGRTAPPAAAALPPQLMNEELLEKLADYVGGCHDALAELMPGASDAERARLRAAIQEFCSIYAKFNDPKSEVGSAEWSLFEEYKALFRKVDRARLLAVGRRAARLADPIFLATLGRRVAKTARAGVKVEGFAGDVVATAGNDPSNRVVLLGASRTTVTGRAALVIDLGGDDAWQRAAVVDDPSALVSVVLELNGNDTYSSTTPGPAFAAGGIALLVDVRGKETYTSGRLGQGASTFGCAALVDLEGDERYTAADYGQGFSFCGVALLVDRSGHDRYDAWAFAQGAGLGNSFAACVDGGGNDRYVANGHWPDVYGDSGPGSYQGLAQGYCTGIRQLRSDSGGVAEVVIPGGIGVLVDAGEGKDYYESGNFSQGGGYYFSFGLMYDGGGDDENHGYRYSQGFGVHQAVGMRWDAGGNDVYVTKCAANCGAAWDQGVGWLLDEGGDDQYDVGGLALGGAAQTAVAVLIDGGGSDRYGGGGGADSQGGTGGKEYHEKEGVPQSLGLLIDLGGGKDSYTRSARGDGLLLTGDLHGLFVDAKEKALDALLEPKALARLLAARKQ